ncbi:hypothetical protein H2248_005673 [Termitomyces sp. 'cryptogamus']|nr:hypothetical protein H2248_005673 [Termitomyces sp. 'cryptogamus']
MHLQPSISSRGASRGLGWYLHKRSPPRQTLEGGKGYGAAAPHEWECQKISVSRLAGVVGVASSHVFVRANPNMFSLFVIPQFASHQKCTELSHIGSI